VNGRMVAIFASALVVIAVVGGLYFAGSPGEARLRRQDDRREELLNSASYAIERYHGEHGRLPAVLDSAGPEWARDSLGARDPVTGVPFDYRTVSDSSYELCATFARGSEGEPTRSWNHPEGRHCFRRRIDAHRGDDHDH
jgi:hypothetical protein